MCAQAAIVRDLGRAEPHGRAGCAEELVAQGGRRPRRGRAQTLAWSLRTDGLAVQLAVLHYDAAVPVRVHSDDLPTVIGFRHKGLPTWWRRVQATSSIRQERRPAPSSHQ